MSSFVTYGDLALPSADADSKFECAVDVARAQRPMETVPTTPELFARGSATARSGYRQWGAVDWPKRRAVLLRAADLVAGRIYDFAAAVTLAVGKNRTEAVGEAEELVTFLRYYCDTWDADGARPRSMDSGGAPEINVSVWCAYGVWAVIAPFNYPLALAGGPAAAALATGNAVILKPSPVGVVVASMLRDVLIEAGVPADAVVLLPGGADTGADLVAAHGIDGVTFTGSSAAGAQVIRTAAARRCPIPALCEMGGKNAAIVAADADVAAAAQGVCASAFAFGGQKCSSCSRVLVHASVYNDFVAALAGRMDALVIGDPVDAGVFTGPLIDDAAYERWRHAVVEARGAGFLLHEVRVPELDLPRLAVPVVVEPPRGHRIWTDELFVPVLALSRFDSFDDAIDELNNSEYGLTAGVYSAEERTVDDFMERAEAGVLYANRPNGATTGAWPGQQPFGGWKVSGNNGPGGGGAEYVRQYARQQSQTRRVANA